ncbi:hypothetical protein [Bradyrhizobium sp. LB13.1]
MRGNLHIRLSRLEANRPDEVRTRWVVCAEPTADEMLADLDLPAGCYVVGRHGDLTVEEWFEKYAPQEVRH